MEFSWRLKALLALFLVLLSVWLLVPSYGNFKEKREQAAETGQSLPFYYFLFSKDQLQLGLDLKGGIYVELEVKLQKALEQRVRVFSSQVARYLSEEGLGDPKASVIELPDLGEVIKLKFNKPEEKAPALAWIQANYGLNWESMSPQSLPPQARQEGESLSKLIFLKPTSSALDEIKEETLSQAVSTVRNRIDRFGVAEPSIRRSGSQRLVVEMPGEKDPERILSLIMKPGRLEFRLVDPTLKTEELETLIETARQELGLDKMDFTSIAVDKLNLKLQDKLPENTEVAFQVVYDPVSKKASAATPYLLNKNVPVSGDMLKNAQVGTRYNEAYVGLTFDDQGTKAFGELTKANVGKRLAIVLDGQVNSAPVIQDAILGGQASITFGSLSTYEQQMQEAKDLVLVLREGSLPAELHEVTKTVIGPSLGERSIKRGFQALIVAALAVMVFMALWYKLAGLLADVALILNLLFIFGILTLFGATLTLPGLAGIVLTLGMAVDANVIILERIKEELKAGKRVRVAVTEGYAHAKSAIVDANITTFLAGVVLYQFGTGPVRGFAVTLMVGILTTLYTAMMLTKIFYEYKASKRGEMKISL